MALLKTIYAESETDPGQWFVWKQEGEETIEFKVRHLPPAERKRINLKHLGKKRRLSLGNRVEQEYEVNAQAEATREMAAYCLMDSKGFTFPAGPMLAERLTEALGEKVGASVTLDGHWSEDVKDLMLRSGFGAELQAFIDEKAAEILQQKKDEEGEASGN